MRARALTSQYCFETTYQSILLSSLNDKLELLRPTSHSVGRHKTAKSYLMRGRGRGVRRPATLLIAAQALIARKIVAERTQLFLCAISAVRLVRWHRTIYSFLIETHAAQKLSFSSKKATNITWREQVTRKVLALYLFFPCTT
eukprot:2016167-Pleurochrysis_carterae.AAC.2